MTGVVTIVPSLNRSVVQKRFEDNRFNTPTAVETIFVFEDNATTMVNSLFMYKNNLNPYILFERTHYKITLL